METADRVRHLFRYEQYAHEKVLAALEAAAEEARLLPAFQDAIDLMAHINAARLKWLWRLEAGTIDPQVLFPKNVQLAELRLEMRDAHNAWNCYLETLTDSDMSKVLEYRTMDGRPWKTRVDDILTQLYGHSFYHRGQVALLMRQAGAVPAPTDYLFWLREQG